MTVLDALEQVPLWDTVVERLLHEDGKRTPKSDPALLIKPKINSLKCFECGKVGHVRKTCRVFLGKMKSNNKDGNSAKITRASVDKLQSVTVRCDFSCHLLS